MDAFNEVGIHTIVVMSSSQIGKTAILKSVIGYYIDQDPAPILVVNPTEAMAETFSKDRLAPMLRDSPCLKNRVADPKSRDSGNTMLSKRFIGGHLTMIGANAPSALASRPIRILLCDEVDRYPTSAGTEGDPVNLATKRTATFHNRKILLTSTPTIKGASRIEAAYLRSDQRHFLIPCPHCGTFQMFKWSNISWQKGEPESAVYLCSTCAATIDESQKHMMIANGHWEASVSARGIAGFHINELYSPWRRWSDVVTDFLAAKSNPQTLKTWINTSLGETFEEESERFDANTLLTRRENYSPRFLPNNILYLTAGVDTQDNRLEVEIVGWRQEEREAPPESWGVEYYVLNGDPAQAQVWNELDTLLTSEWRTEDNRLLKVGATCIDAGGHRAAQVYAYCNARRGRHIYAIRGLPGNRPIWVPKASKSKKYQSPVWLVGADAAKDAWYARLRITDVGPGYCHFPVSYQEFYFAGVTSEQVRTKYVRGHPHREWWLPDGKRNEPLDCRVYALAALLARPVPWRQLLTRSGTMISMPSHTPAPKAQRRRKETAW